MLPRPEPFRVAVTDEELGDLHDRLRRTRWAPEFGNETWSYGFSGTYLRELTAYWLNEYDWRSEEARINSFAHYRLMLDEVPIHFIHERGRGPAPIPIVLTHGWPWTFWDFHALIGPLSDPAAHGGDPADAFHVIVPSLPGFTFSNPLTKTGSKFPYVAKLWDQLLREVLGYEKYAAAGGDMGAGVSHRLGHEYAQNLIGLYVSTPPLDLAVDLTGGVTSLKKEDFAPDEQPYYARGREKLSAQVSHVAVHTHDPQTLAWALNDSPVGLAAWLIERRRAWSDCDGDVERSFSRDFLLTTVCLNWFTQSFGASVRFYADMFRDWPGLAHDRKPAIEAPTGYGIFPGDVNFMPRRICERVSNLQRWTIMPHGGHFAPAEEPAAFVGELREFFRPLR